MYRKLLAAAIAAIALAVAGSPVARADQAVLVDFVGPVAPGETIEWTFELVVAGHGLPNVAYENAESFVTGETVTATITPVVEPEGFGSATLVSEPTLVGTTSDDWNTGEYGEFGEIHFAPPVVLRYTAPSLEDLGCADHPGAMRMGHLGVLADFQGDAGTIAHIDPLMNGETYLAAQVPITFDCPASEPTDQPPAQLTTPPPTDVDDARPGGVQPAAIVTLILLGLVAAAGLAWPALRRGSRSRA